MLNSGPLASPSTCEEGTLRPPLSQLELSFYPRTKLNFGAIFEVSSKELVGSALQARCLSAAKLLTKSRFVRKRPALSSALQRCERTVRGGFASGQTRSNTHPQKCTRSNVRGVLRSAGLLTRGAFKPPEGFPPRRPVLPGCVPTLEGSIEHHPHPAVRFQNGRL